MTQEFSENKFLSHVNAQGEVAMVDVSEKVATFREAIAAGQIKMSHAAFEAIAQGNSPKGEVLATAQIAGIMGAKRTAELIPLCHPLPLQKIAVEIRPDPLLPGYQIEARAKTKAATGVEMEALTAVAIAALTIYDMAKAIDKSLEIGAIRLIKKTGGKSDLELQ